MQLGWPVSPVPATQALLGELPSEVVQAWSELEDQYGTGPSAGDSRLSPVTETPVISSSIPAPDEAFSSLNLSVEDQDRTTLWAEQLMELSLSSCLDNGSEVSDEEGEAPCR